MNTKQLQLLAFMQIRRKLNNFEDKLSNDEIAGYVKGVVDLETEMYSALVKEVIEVKI